MMVDRGVVAYIVHCIGWVILTAVGVIVGIWLVGYGLVWLWDTAALLLPYG